MYHSILTLGIDCEKTNALVFLLQYNNNSFQKYYNNHIINYL